MRYERFEIFSLVVSTAGLSIIIFFFSFLLSLQHYPNNSPYSVQLQFRQQHPALHCLSVFAFLHCSRRPSLFTDLTSLAQNCVSLTTLLWWSNWCISPAVCCLIQRCCWCWNQTLSTRSTYQSTWSHASKIDLIRNNMGDLWVGSEALAFVTELEDFDILLLLDFLACR